MVKKKSGRKASQTKVLQKNTFETEQKAASTSLAGKGLVLLSIAFLGLCLRLAPLMKTDFGIESDEAIVGLMANHILEEGGDVPIFYYCLLYTSPSPRDATLSRMPSSA